MKSVTYARRMILTIAAVGLMNLSWTALPAVGEEMGLTVEGLTRPSQRLNLSFHFPGIVGEVAVKEGDIVEAGQLLIAADDRMERRQHELMELEAESTLPIEAAQAELELRRLRLERMIEGRASQFELDEARAAVKLSEIQVARAREEREQKALQVEQQKVRLERMRLLSPVDGIVERIESGVGEVVDPSRPSIAIVRNDPLWVDVQLRPEVAAQLNPGQSVEVSYPGDENWQQATVIYFAPVVTADRRLVRLEMANASNEASGLRVRVRLPAEVIEGARR